MGILCAGASDIGRKRKSNQDSIWLDPIHHLYAVADGMGGHNGGDVASQLCVKIISDYLARHSSNNPQELMRDMIYEINQAIFALSLEKSELHGMGTTLCAMLISGQNLILGNVGDSRAYLINQQSLFQLTRDHTFVQEKLNQGIYSREDAQKDPQKNILIRSVGLGPEILVDIFHYTISKNDIFLLCSDGLHGKVSDRDILETIQQNISDPSTCVLEDIQRTVNLLIQKANDNGGQDNISVILAVAQA